jgi:hypothetical protein
MRFTKIVAASAFALAVLAAGTAAFAGDGTLTVQVPFTFSAGKTTVPAGVYTLREQTADTLVLDSVWSPAIHVMVPVIARLSGGRESAGRLVFDKSGKALSLAEIWIGDDDGYLVEASNGPHALTMDTK